MMLYCAGASSHSGVRPPGNIAGNEDHSWARPSTASIQALAGQDYPSGILWAGPQPQADGLSNLPYGLCDAFHGQTDAHLRDFAFAPEEVTFLETVLRRKSDDGSSNRQLNQYGFTNAATAPVAPHFEGRCFEPQTLPDFASTTMPNQSAQNPIGSATTTNTTTATAVSPFGPHSAPFSPPGYNSSLCLANALSAPITMTTCTNALPSNPDQPRPQFNVGRSGSAADHCLRLVRPSPLRICNPHRDNFLPPTSQQYWITNVPSWISCPSSLTTCAAASAPAPPPPTAAAAAAVPATVPWPWSASQIQSSWQQQQPQQQQPQQQPQQQQQQQQLKALPAQHPALHHHPHSLLLRSQPQRQSLPPRPSTNTAILNDDSMLDEMLLEEIKAAPWPTTNLRQCGTTGCICARDGVLGGGSAAPSPGASDSVCAQMPSTGMAITLSKMATASVEAPPKPTGGASISFLEPFVWSPNTSFAGPVQPLVWGPPPGNHTQTDLTAQHPAIAVPTTQSQRSAVPCALPQLPPAPGATGLSSRNANYVDIAAANGSTSAPATASPSADLGSLPPLWYSSPQQQPPQVKSDTHSQPPQAMDPRLQNPQPTAQPSNSRRVMARPAARRPTHALRGGGPFALLPQPTAAVHHLHSSGSLDRSSADTQTRLEGAASAGGGEGGRSAGSIVAPATETSLASDAGGIIAGTAMAARSGRSRQSLTLEALRAMFELPAQDVVVALGISATDLKRRCRALGIRRWPHRKLASLKRLAEAIEADDEIGQEERQVVLDRVAANRSKIFADPDAEFDPGLKSLRQVQYKRHFVERQHGVVL